MTTTSGSILVLISSNLDSTQRVGDFLSKANVANVAGPATPSVLPADLAHDAMASFLRDDDDDNNSCLRVAEVSRALLESYGGCLTSVLFAMPRAAAPLLTALLQRQQKFEKVLTDKHDEAISGLCQAIVQGCYARVEFLNMYGSDEPIVTQEG